MNLLNAPLVLVGLPFDENSSHLTGAAQAPSMIREALHSGATNLCCENGRDLADGAVLTDGGDAGATGGARLFDTICNTVSHWLDAGYRVVSLGGDHSVSWPVLTAYHRHFDAPTVVQFDAHPDLYDEFDGNPFSHASPFARIMEAGLARQLIQVGIRSMTPHQRRQARRWPVSILGMEDDLITPLAGLSRPVYLSIDLDVLDPAFAPGVSHPEPGGMSTRRLLDCIHAICAPIIGVDIVEYNPSCDINHLTGKVAAKCLKEVCGQMLRLSGDGDPS